MSTNKPIFRTSVPQEQQHFLPAGLEAFQLLYEEGFEHLGALEEGRVVGVVVAAVVEDFGHVRHELCELLVMSLLQTGFHCGKVLKERQTSVKRTSLSPKAVVHAQGGGRTHRLLDHAVIIRRIVGIHRFEKRPRHFVRLTKTNT